MLLATVLSEHSGFANCYPEVYCTSLQIYPFYRALSLEYSNGGAKPWQCIQRSALFPGRADGRTEGSDQFVGGAVRRGGVV